MTTTTKTTDPNSHLWRACVRSAHSYVKYLTETHPGTLRAWSQFYRTDDLRGWATARIEANLEYAAKVWPLIEDQAQAQSEVATWLNELRAAGFGHLLPGRSWFAGLPAAAKLGPEAKGVD